MTTKISPEAQGIIDRLAAVDTRTVVVDRGRAERALAAHFKALQLSPLPVRWVSDAEAAYLHVFRAARSAARSAAGSAAWSAAWSAAGSAAESAADRQAIRACTGIWLPFVDAYEAGLWLFFVCRDEVVAVPRPMLQLEGDRLHCANGPAVSWPGGSAYYFWRGVQVPADVILQPAAISVPRIDGEPNAEIRRILIERYGLSRFLLDGGAAIRHRDDTGVLYSRDIADDEPLVMVQVRNATPEPDGSCKEYFIRVPPLTQTAREAVAWTFGLTTGAYHPSVET